MIHEILPVGPLQCNCSIFGDERSGEALVVDPGDEISSVLEIVARHGLTVKAIVITHAHIDHIGGAAKLKRATGAPVYMNQEDAALQKMMDVQATWIGVRTPEPVEIDVAATDGGKLVVGATEFHVLHTPGHTQGSISLWIPIERRIWRPSPPGRSVRPMLSRNSVSPATNFRSIGIQRLMQIGRASCRERG